MITLRGLTKRHGDTVAVDGLTLDIEEGRVTADPDDLRGLADRLLVHDGVSVEPARPPGGGAGERNEIAVRGLTGGEIGDLAHRLGVRLHQLHSVCASLGQAYMELTEHSVEYATRTAKVRPR
ncbi:hypothetical protein ACH4XT_10645 [Streptomyces avidinii]|uniref:hypothetical protein n=1 Tax=Streptomyces avidinii TaxID=1895 RepID=UPI0037ABE49C